MKKIVFTGGGTAGHVTPNLALITALEALHWHIDYIGSKASIEKTLVEKAGIAFHEINSGKLRRYFSLKTLLAPLMIIAGFVQSLVLLTKLKPAIVFSKGGFVAFPVVVAAWVKRIPVVAHESDLTPGLANRLSFPFVKVICLTFENAKSYFKKQKSLVVTGTPIRLSLFQGTKQRGLEVCNFTDVKPTILVMGGSSGSVHLNRTLRQSLPELLTHYQIIHLCGRGNFDSAFVQPGYVQFEYADENLPDLLATADLVVSRAGANSLYELLALNKPNILIPLSAKVSRGDQIQNAAFFEALQVSTVISDEQLSSILLIQTIDKVIQEKQVIIERIRALNITSATDQIITILEQYSLH